MKIRKHVEITGVLTARTGLKIGGTKEGAGIGETDNPILRHPITRLPYVPGSSLKGKIRSLLEAKHSPQTQRSGRPCDCSECDVCALFGSAVQNRREADQKLRDLGPTRLIFRDAMLNSDYEDEVREALPGSYVEVKTEIAMDRSTGATKQGSLRQQERIPEGASFDLNITLRLFEEDFKMGRAEKYLNLLAEGFEMLEKDYLGGCGTRGYGQVMITADQDGTPPLAQVLRDSKFRQEILA